jgi:quinol monooxygenase YgiN
MYGTVTRLRFKSEVDGGRVLQSLGEVSNVPGLLFQYVYHVEATPDVWFLAAGFENKEAYQVYAASHDQDASTDTFRALLADEPEVNGGEIVAATVP